MSANMKMVMIAFNEAVDDEVMEAIEDCGLKSYTKIVKAFGKGELSGTHLGNDIWPGLNNIVYVVCDDPSAKVITEKIRDIRRALGREGVKAFVMPVEDIT